MAESHPYLFSAHSRRTFLAIPARLLPAGLLLLVPNIAAPAAAIPSQKTNFIDAATEFPLIRWTEENASAQIPADTLRAISRDDGRLLYASDRSGSWQPYVMQIPKGDSSQLTEVEQLHPDSLTFLADGKELIYLDGVNLVRVHLQRKRVRTLYEVRDGWQFTGDLRTATDDRSTVLVEAKDGDSRLVLVDLASGKARTLFTLRQGVAKPLLMHPRLGVLVTNAQGQASFQGGVAPQKLDTFPEGEILDAHLDRQGRHLTYLLRIPGAAGSVQLMELNPQDGVHTQIASTSKFATFAPNSNASVFVGASSSLAQPLLLLLLRVTRREFPLVEHAASAPPMVRPIFTHDSETIFFQSDRQGKSSIFSTNVKGLVEKT